MFLQNTCLRHPPGQRKNQAQQPKQAKQSQNSSRTSANRMLGLRLMLGFKTHVNIISICYQNVDRIPNPAANAFFNDLFKPNPRGKTRRIKMLGLEKKSHLKTALFFCLLTISKIITFETPTQNLTGQPEPRHAHRNRGPTRFRRAAQPEP